MDDTRRNSPAQRRGVAEKSGIEQQLDTLLRGEIATAEAYKQVIDDLGDAPEAKPLRAIQQDHGEAIGLLYSELASRGAEPATGSGAPGAFARIRQKLARLFGGAPALLALRKRETRAVKAYEKALRNGTLPSACRTRVEEQLLPRQRRHIEVLGRLIASA